MRSLKKTPLNQAHHALRAKMTEFAGWELPAWYTSILAEHRAVRSRAGMFDVSHMG
ncbi:MAG: glycine cleavage system aminomethyltransferase GcvT, partial [Chloroflexi bacterium]